MAKKTYSERIKVIPLTLPPRYQNNPLLNGEWKIGIFETQASLDEKYGKETFEAYRHEALEFLATRLARRKSTESQAQSGET